MDFATSLETVLRWSPSVSRRVADHDRRRGQSTEKDAIWTRQPAVYRLTDGPKGEGHAFRLDTGDLLSIGEEKSGPAALYETAEQC